MVENPPKEKRDQFQIHPVDEAIEQLLVVDHGSSSPGSATATWLITFLGISQKSPQVIQFLEELQRQIFPNPEIRFACLQPLQVVQGPTVDLTFGYVVLSSPLFICI